MNIEPLNDRVVLRQLKKDRSERGTVKETARTGKVVAVGPGKLLEDGKRSKMSVKNGDIVIYARFADEATINGIKFIIVSEEVLLGVVRD